MLAKKGSLSSQMFLYAFGIIVVILIVFAGYKAIQVFKTSSETSGFKVLSAKFSSDMTSISSRTGEVKKFTYSVPSGYNTFCVFDLTNANMKSAIFNFYPFLKNSLYDKTENVFFIKGNNFFAFKIGDLRINKYPYYSCTDIKEGSVTFSAKGSVIDGQQSAQVLVSNKVEQDITSISEQHGGGRILTSDFELISSDGLAKIIIPSGTLVTMPSTNTSFYIEISNSGPQSEDYLFGPTGTTFSNNIRKGFKHPNCAKFNEYPLSSDLNHFGDACEKGFILFDVTSI